MDGSRVKVLLSPAGGSAGGTMRGGKTSAGRGVYLKILGPPKGWSPLGFPFQELPRRLHSRRYTCCLLR